MPYEFQRDDAFSLASYLGVETRQKGNELEFRECPYCHGGSHGDKWTFSINLDKGCFNCLRGSCAEQGHFRELCRDLNYKIDDGSSMIFRKMEQPDGKIASSRRAIEYMKSRGISEEVTRKYEITTLTARESVIAFPFYNDQGELVMVKYRNTAYKKGGSGSKEWCSTDTMPILFGMNNCTGFDQLIITEGQIDSLSVAQAGFANAVSVPTGCNGFTWTKYTGDWVRKFKEIIVFGDYENGSMTLIDQIRTRFAPIKIRAVRYEDYLGEKDANDILRKYGEQAIVKCIVNAEVQQLENVKDLSTVRSVDLSKLDKIETGFYDLDRMLYGGMCVGQVLLLTGKRGDGKSTFMSQLIANALDKGESIFAYSGELADFHFKRWLDYQLCGSRNLGKELNAYGEYVGIMKDDIQQLINDWYKGRAYIFDNEFIPEGKTEKETIIQTVEKVIKNYNCRLICIDNLMTAMDDCPDQRNLYLFQSKFVGDLKKIAMKYQVVVILVAHPRKSGAEFSNDDVSGSADITNKVDIVLNYCRNEDKTESSSLLMVTKNRLGGFLADTKEHAIRLNYSPISKRIYQKGKEEKKAYSWETFNGAYQSQQLGIPWDIDDGEED